MTGRNLAIALVGILSTVTPLVTAWGVRGPIPKAHYWLMVAALITALGAVLVSSWKVFESAASQDSTDRSSIRVAWVVLTLAMLLISWQLCLVVLGFAAFYLSLRNRSWREQAPARSTEVNDLAGLVRGLPLVRPSMREPLVHRWLEERELQRFGSGFLGHPSPTVVFCVTTVAAMMMFRSGVALRVEELLMFSALALPWSLQSGRLAESVESETSPSEERAELRRTPEVTPASFPLRFVDYAPRDYATGLLLDQPQSFDVGPSARMAILADDRYAGNLLQDLQGMPSDHAGRLLWSDDDARRPLVLSDRSPAECQQWLDLTKNDKLGRSVLFVTTRGELAKYADEVVKSTNQYSTKSQG